MIEAWPWVLTRLGLGLTGTFRLCAPRLNNTLKCLGWPEPGRAVTQHLLYAMPTFRYLNLILYDQLPQEFFQYVAETDSSGNRLFNFFNNNLQKIVDSRHFNIIVSNLALGWSTSTQNTMVGNKLKKMGSQGSLARNFLMEAFFTIFSLLIRNWVWVAQTSSGQPVCCWRTTDVRDITVVLVPPISVSPRLNLYLLVQHYFGRIVLFWIVKSYS